MEEFSNLCNACFCLYGVKFSDGIIRDLNFPIFQIYVCV